MPTITGGISIGGGKISNNLKIALIENGVKIPFSVGAMEYTNEEINDLKLIDPMGKELKCEGGLITEKEPV